MDLDYIKKVQLLKKDAIDVEATKRYITKIKTMFNELLANTEGELTLDEALEQFLDAYRKDLKFDRGKTLKNIYVLLKYCSYKELISLYKGNKLELRRIISEAKKLEKTSNKEPLEDSFDAREELVLSMREVLRDNPNLKEKDLLSILIKKKNSKVEDLKHKLIKSIQNNVDFLIEYGEIDEYIEASNELLKHLGLEEIMFQKRNPIPDEYEYANGDIVRYDEQKNIYVKYDSEGKEVNDGEDLSKYEQDIGVIDSFDEDFLIKYTPEDLFMMDLFYRSKYVTERLQLSKAMYAMEKMGIWRQVLEGNQEDFEQIDSDSILKCFQSQDEEENQLIMEEIENIENAMQGLSLQECTLVSKLKAKNLSIKSWGTIDYADKDENVNVVIDSENFRGTLYIEIPKTILMNFIDEDVSKLPKFKGIVDKNYLDLMSNICVLATNFYKKYIMSKYKSDPSPLFAGLAHKKVKTKEER